MLLSSLVLFMTTTVIVSAQHSSYLGQLRGQDGVLIKPSKRSGCPLPAFPENGEYQIKDPRHRLRIGSLTGTGTILIYFCEESYELTTDRAVCLGTGRWSANPECHIRRTQRQPCNLPNFPKNGAYHIQGAEKSAKVGDPIESYSLLQYSCDEGFELSVNVSICLGGTWSANPQCVAIVDTRCALPERPAHGTYQISPPGLFKAATPGQLVSQYTILEYSCDYGLEPTKSVTLCLENNKWSDLPECQPIPNFLYPNYTANDGCGLPAKPDHGFYVVENYDRPLVPGDKMVPYTVLNFFCEGNYVPSHILTVCKQDKTWSANVTCRKSCEMMTSNSVNFVCMTSDHKRVACDQIMPHGSTVHSFCRAGFSPVGELDTVRCIEGKWSNRMPECLPDGGKVSTSWNFGIFQETGGNVLPMCVFIDGQVAIRVPQTIAQVNNQQRLPANYYTFEGGKFFKLPGNQLEQAIFDSSAEDTIQGVAQPGKVNKPKKPKKPSTTTPNEIFPSLSPNNPDYDPQQKPRSKCKQVCDDNQIFADFVASTLRNFNSDQNKRKLKLSIQELILEATKDDDYVSFVLNSDTTHRPVALDENGQNFAYNPETDEPVSSPGLDVRFEDNP